MKPQKELIEKFLRKVVQKNTSPLSIFHRNWFWSSLPFQNERQEKTFSPSLPNGTHYIELWADRTPTLHRARFDASGRKDISVQARVVWESATLRPAPRTGPKDFGTVARNERVSVLEKAIAGERIINPSGVALSTDRWHKVKYKNQEGYIYSLALTIDGEDAQSVRELIIQKSREIQEDHCLMLAIAQRESKFFPYEVSDKGAQGVFQLKEDAMTDVNQKFQKNFSDHFDMRQNIEADILYFQLVKNRYKGRDYFWERCLAAWNRGWGYIHPDKPFLLAHQPITTRQFIQDVFSVWNKCKKAGGVFMVALLAVGVILISAVSVIAWKKHSPEAFAIPNAYAHDVMLRNQKVDIDSDGKDDRLVVMNDNPHSTFGTTKVLFIRKDNSFVKLPDEGDEFQWIKTGDFNRNGLMDVAVLYGYSGSAGFGHFYVYEWDKGAFKTTLTLEDISSEVDFLDLNNDGVKEIIYRFRPSKWSAEKKEIYRWQNEKMAYAKLPKH